MQTRVLPFLTLLLPLSALAAAAPATADTAQGTVFEDLNRNGALDAGEPGMAGVHVSDGRQVVRTDARGRWQLEVTDDCVLFITKPAGFAPPLNADNLPRFHYLHMPAGSPAYLRFPGVAPTGPLPPNIDFALVRKSEPAAFEAILFSDTQPQSEAEVDWVRDTAVQELIGARAAFGMNMGDIMFDDLSLYPRLNRVIGQIGVPWYNVPGNHEIDYSARDDAHSLETFKRWFGPTYYAFNYGEALFVVLDDIEYKGVSNAEYPKGLRAGGTFEARISERQLQWLANELADVPADRLIVLAMHSPLRTATGAPDRPEANVTNRRDLFRVLKGHSNVFALAGHTHMIEHMYFGAEDGWTGSAELHQQMLAAVSGSWWSGPIDTDGVPVSDLRDGAPRGYHILEVTGSRATVRFKPVGRPATEQMRIVFDTWHNAGRADLYRDFRPGALFAGRMTTDEVPSAAVVVNLFDGGPRSLVEMSLDGQTWLPMQRRLAADPYLVESFARHRAAVKSWVNPELSTHLFVGKLPGGLVPGTYVVRVRARDEYGRTHLGQRVVEITGSSAPPLPGAHYQSDQRTDQ